MSIAYKVEELLALRDSVSESAVSFDKFADEDVIKEHVLRPSASASAYLKSRTSSNSLHPSAALATESLVPTATYKRPSPSPSVKRGKAEKLLKEHGSPPGMRVTAGGRVVPNDLLPLGTSRFPENSYKSQIFRVSPGSVMPTQTHPNSSDTARIEVVGGQPVILVGDRMFALPAVSNTPTPTFSSLGVDSNTKRVPDAATLSVNASVPSIPLGPSRAHSQSPLAGLDIGALRAQQTLKKQELRTVEQTEVLQASHQSETWRAAMIEKKRCLIVELDALRKQISALEDDLTSSNQPTSFLGPIGTIPGTTSQSSFVPQFAHPPTPAIYTHSEPTTYAPMMMYQPQYGVYPGYPMAADAPSFVVAPPHPPVSPGSAGRRSHAVEIKPPQEENKKQPLSALDPKSPTYEPSTKSGHGRNMVAPTPSPTKQSPWRIQGDYQTRQAGMRASSHKPSLSSIDTTDFFPTNTHEHSTTRLAPKTDDPKQSSAENAVMPSTPEKQWPASPWNEGTSGRSKNKEPTTKLTSWPEAFGKQRSSSSLRQSDFARSTSVIQERAPVIGAYVHTAPACDSAVSKASSGQRQESDENWPFSRKAVTHVPSTYQEGYQAGYDHVGMPDNAEVLQGFIQGLLHFLSDESKKGRRDPVTSEVYVRGIEARTPSLRGLVAGSMPHDSAVSMTFTSRNDLDAGQENVRSCKSTLASDPRAEPVYSPNENIKGGLAMRSYLDAAGYASHPQNVMSPVYSTSAGMGSECLPPGRHSTASFSGNNASDYTQDKGTLFRNDASTSNGVPRSFSGTQVQNRGYGTPFSMQRFYPTPREVGLSGYVGDETSIKRPVANHRLSGLDGAMDDLAEMMTNSRVDDQRPSSGIRSTEVPIPTEAEEATASCFKSSGNKGKQKATASPKKAMDEAQDQTVSSPVNMPSSPKKSGEHSPAKVKLEHVTNKFRRSKKDDARTMSPEDKMERTRKWRTRFQQLKKTEQEEIEQYRKNTRN